MSSEPLQALRFVVPAQHVQAALSLFEEIALSVTAFEHDGDGREDAAHWIVEAVFAEAPSIDAFRSELDALAATERRIEALPDADWLAEVAEAAKPTRVGPFFVHGSAFRDQRRADDLPIEIDAGLAFGSGEHPTTRACLRALLDFGGVRTPETVLDMGCGSAVLAIAAARCWPYVRVTGVEIDPRAAGVAADNVTLNQVGERVTIVAGDGYAAPIVAENAPYDLILANILPDPLIGMAPDARRMIDPTGLLIVSGLLERSTGQVSDAHILAGFELAARIIDDGWAALVFKPV